MMKVKRFGPGDDKRPPVVATIPGIALADVHTIDATMAEALALSTFAQACLVAGIARQKRESSVYNEEKVCEYATRQFAALRDAGIVPPCMVIGLSTTSEELSVAILHSEPRCRKDESSNNTNHQLH